MKKNYDTIVSIIENRSIDFYVITVGFQSGKKVFLDEYENEEGVMSFSKFKRILSETNLNDLYKLKENLECKNPIIINFIDEW